MKKSIAIILTIIFVVIMGSIIKNNDATEKIKKENSDSLECEIKKIKPFFDDHKKEEKIVLNTEKIDSLVASFSKDAQNSIHSYTDIFNIVDESEISLINKKNIAPISGIKIPKGKIKKMRVGDIVDIPIVDNIQLSAKITNRTVNKDGSISISGDIENSEKGYSIVMTEGKEEIFISLSTRYGNYEVETKNGEGYVYSSKDIEQKRVDPSIPDAIEID